MIKKEYEKICKRFDKVMYSIGCEHICLNGGEIASPRYREYYGTENGVTIDRMLKEAEYWLSCYYESGNCRCDDRYLDKEEYKIWVSETGMLKRLITALGKFDGEIVVEDMV